MEPEAASSTISKRRTRIRWQQAQDEIRVLIRIYRHLRPQQDDNFNIQSSDTLVSVWNQLTGAIAAAAVGIVSVFMVVGGVVIMNIMLAVVSERTREIGVRKSVGARRQDILNQFLVESSALAGIGGLIGVLIAWLAAVLVRNVSADSDGGVGQFGGDRLGPVDGGGLVLRHLSGPASRGSGSHRGAAGGELN